MATTYSNIKEILTQYTQRVGDKRYAKIGTGMKIVYYPTGLPTADATHLQELALVDSSSTTTQNLKDEFVVVTGGTTEAPTYAWEQIGSTYIDTTGFIKKVDTLSATGAGITLGGSYATPTVSVAAGSIVSGDANVVTGGTVYTKLTNDYVAKTALSDKSLDIDANSVKVNGTTVSVEGHTHSSISAGTASVTTSASTGLVSIAGSYLSINTTHTTDFAKGISTDKITTKSGDQSTTFIDLNYNDGNIAFYDLNASTPIIALGSGDIKFYTVPQVIIGDDVYGVVIDSDLNDYVAKTSSITSTGGNGITLSGTYGTPTLSVSAGSIVNNNANFVTGDTVYQALKVSDDDFTVMATLPYGE